MHCITYVEDKTSFSAYCSCDKFAWSSIFPDEERRSKIVENAEAHANEANGFTPVPN
jgi:hypothetical protein